MQVEEVTEQYEQQQQQPQSQQVNIGELLLQIQDAYGKMSNTNSHKPLLLMAGAVIIHLFEENQRLKATDVVATGVEPLVSLT